MLMLQFSSALFKLSWSISSSLQRFLWEDLFYHFWVTATLYGKYYLFVEFFGRQFDILWFIGVIQECLNRLWISNSLL